MAGLNKEEFTHLIMQYERLVYTICYQLVQNAATAEDLTQDTFLSAYLHRDAMPPGYERQWLGRIAANKAKDYLQSAWNRRVTLPGDEILPSGQAPPAEAEVLRRFTDEAIRSAILSLRQPYLPVCRMCLLEGRSAEEAALALGRPVKTIRTQLRRGKQLLQTILERSDVRDHLFPR